MFIRYYSFLKQPFAEVERWMVSSDASLRAIAERSANSAGDIGIRFERTGKNPTRFTMGTPIRTRSRGTTLPFVWHADGLATIDGDLEVRGFSGATEVAVSATYEPTFVLAGQLDRSVAQALAEALVKSLVDGIAAECTVSLPSAAYAP